MASQEILGKLEALKEIKAQYLVGSQKAHRYLKAIRYYESLCKELRERGIKYNFTIREIAQATYCLYKATKLCVEFISNVESSLQDFSVATDHSFLMPTLVDEEMIYCRGLDFIWTINPTPALLGIFFLGEMAEESPIELVSTRRIFEFLMGAGRNIGFLTLLTHGRSCGLKGAILENISLRDVAANADLRRSDLPHFIQDVDTCINISDSTKEDALFPKLKSSFDAKRWGLCHRTYKAIQNRFFPISFIYESENLLNAEASICEESRLLLDPDSLYERAKKEYTLGTLTVERQIALSIARQFMDSHKEVLSEKQQITAAIDESIKYYLRTKNKYVRELSKEWSPWATEELKEQYVYYYLALRKNRPWLIDFFSR